MYRMILHSHAFPSDFLWPLADETWKGALKNGLRRIVQADGDEGTADGDKHECGDFAPRDRAVTSPQVGWASSATLA